MSSHHLAGLRTARLLLMQLRLNYGVDPALLRPDSQDYARGVRDALQQFDRVLSGHIGTISAKMPGRAPADVPPGTWPA